MDAFNGGAAAAASRMAPLSTPILQSFHKNKSIDYINVGCLYEINKRDTQIYDYKHS